MAERASSPEQTSLVRRVFGSAWLRVLLFATLFLTLTTFVLGGMGERVQDNQLEFLEDAVRRSAVQCYALEGQFPLDVAYLEENYGLIIDRNNYIVYYESLGGNLTPQIRVMPVMR